MDASPCVEVTVGYRSMGARIEGPMPSPRRPIRMELLRRRAGLIAAERRRVRRIRRRFVYALLFVLFYLLAFAPTVFVYLDNPLRRRQGMSVLDWSEGLYWSVVTLTTVGYGDIVPQTPYARMFALFTALLGATTLGVIAGLVLNVMTPRPRGGE